jgi:hypothetical protein
VEVVDDSIHITPFDIRCERAEEASDLIVDGEFVPVEIEEISRSESVMRVSARLDVRRLARDSGGELNDVCGYNGGGGSGDDWIGVTVRHESWGGDRCGDGRGSSSVAGAVSRWDFWQYSIGLLVSDSPGRFKGLDW